MLTTDRSIALLQTQPLDDLVRLKPAAEGGVFLVERVLTLDSAPLISAEAQQEEGYFQRYSLFETRERDLMQEEMRVAMIGDRAVGAYAIEGILHQDQSSFIEGPATLRFLAVDPAFFSHELVAVMVRDAVKVARRWSHDHIAVNLSRACPEKRDALQAAGFCESVGSEYFLLDFLTQGSGLVSPR